MKQAELAMRWHTSLAKFVFCKEESRFVTFKWLLSKHVGEERVRNLMFPDKSYFQDYFLLVPENLAQCPMCFESAGMVWSLTSSASLMQSRYLVNCASQQSFFLQKTRSPGWVCGWDPTENNEWNNGTWMYHLNNQLSLLEGKKCLSLISKVGIEKFPKP